MPTYQYRCTACDERLEVVQSFSDASLTECPACGGQLRKMFNAVGVVFKGSGFYRTDSRSPGSGNSGESGSSGDPGSTNDAAASSTAGTHSADKKTSESGSGSGSSSGSGSGKKDTSGSSAGSAKKPAASAT